MPRISDEQRRANEARFVDAARRCFTRLGVEGTSMDQIRSEAGVSAGLMYRYFRSKDDMIQAAIGESLAQFELLVAAVTRDACEAGPGNYLRVLLTEAQRFRRHAAGVDLFALAIQGWAHAQARPAARAVITASFERQLTLFATAATAWTTRARAQDVARAIASIVIGFIVQGAFSDDDIDVTRYCRGVTGLAG